MPHAEVASQLLQDATDVALDVAQAREEPRTGNPVQRQSSVGGRWSVRARSSRRRQDEYDDPDEGGEG